MGPDHLAELAVEGAERQVTGLVRNLQHKAIVKPERCFGAELSQRGRDNVGILQGQGRMRQPSLQCRPNL